MESKRSVKLCSLDPQGTLQELSEWISKVLIKYPHAAVESFGEYADRYDAITISVDKTELDYQIESVCEQLDKLPHSWSSQEVPRRVVVISQDTPIEENVLEKIKNDGKNDKYWLHFNGCVLERWLNVEELTKLHKKSDKEHKRGVAKRKILSEKLSHLMRLQMIQDAKYKLENM